MEIYEDGEESRDFTYIDDAVNATILSIENDNADGQIFNIGSGSATTVIEVAETLKRAYKSDIDIHITGKYRLGDIRHNFADISKARDLIGFSPSYNFTYGIEKFVSWAGTQEIVEDKYEKSVDELKNKGLMR